LACNGCGIHQQPNYAADVRRVQQRCHQW
jgi:hypothetical protein